MQSQLNREEQQNW